MMCVHFRLKTALIVGNLTKSACV